MRNRGVAIDDLPEHLQRKARALAGASAQPKSEAPAVVGGIAIGPDSPLHHVQATRKRAVDREHPIQVEIFDWIDDPATLAEWPELESAYAIPNEVGAGGKKNARQRQIDGARKKASGRRKGMPDTCLPVPRRNPAGGVFGALYVEVKAEEGTVGKEQIKRIALLRRVGNRCEIVMSADAAKSIFINYLSLPKP